MSTNQKTLENKVVIVTGGASGIGRALGEELAHRGCEVVLADRQHSVAAEVAKGITDRGGRATAAELDVRSLPAFKAIAKDTLQRSGRIDYLFNNAGIVVGGEMASHVQEDWDDVIDVNLRGVVYGIQAVYPIMVKQGSGHILNTASVAGLVAGFNEGAYTATKHAVVAVTKALRVEAERYGVRASVLCPGAIRTPIVTGGVYGRINVENVSKEAIMRMSERLRPISPEELARRTLDAVARNEAIIVLPKWWKAFWYLDRLSPALSLKLASYRHKLMREEMLAAGAKPKSIDADA
jgi:NAD(P)-dependent dehydrogenase (short-subunit alcohol dehydrogenase family)